MSRRSCCALAVTIALACGLGACGVGAESQPKVIDRANVPFGLAQRAHSTPTSVPATDATSYTLYFVSDDRLQPVTRTAKHTPTLAAMLRALVRGPDSTETDAGLRTLLTPDVSVHDVTVDQGVATVALNGPGAPSTGSDEQALGIAQIVYTATGLPGVERVRFEVDGRPAEIPRGDGSLSSRAVDRNDYPGAAS